MNNRVLFIFLLMAETVAAQSPDLDFALQSVAQTRQPAEILAFGRPARAVPVPFMGLPMDCPTVGVIYPDSRGVVRGGPRIDNFQVCPGEAARPIRDVSPALPNDNQFRQVVSMTIRNALRGGLFISQWQGYVVETRRLSELDRRGCAITETIVANNGLLVSYNSGRVCL